MDTHFSGKIKINPYSSNDLNGFNRLRLALHEETEFLLLSPIELANIKDGKPALDINEHTFFLLASANAEIVGFLFAQFNEHKRIVDQIQVGVLQAY